MNDYNKEKINWILYHKPKKKFVKNLYIGILSQFLDVGKFDETMRDWALVFLNFLEGDKKDDLISNYKEHRRIISNI
ncbi:MAG: hypothetical protein ACI94Y_003849 [Maribacter sp.]|jgi:hypothetical protein